MTTRLQSFVAGWERWWFAPVRSDRLALVRVLLACSALAKLTGTYGLLSRSVVGEVRSGFPLHRFSAGNWPFDQVNAPLTDLLPRMTLALHRDLETFALVMAVPFALGLFGRVSGVLLGAALLWLASFDVMAFKHNAWTLAVACLLCGLTPCSDRWSVDAWVRQRRSGLPAGRERSVLGARVLQTLVVSIYLFAVTAKLNPSWFGGGMFALFVRISPLDLSGVRGLVDAPAAHLVAGWLTLLAEGFLVFGLLLPRTRAWALATGVMLHLGIELTMDVGAFSLTMMALYAAFLEPIPRLMRRPLFGAPAGATASPWR